MSTSTPENGASKQKADRLPVWRKLAYGFGGPPMQMLSNCLGFYLTVFLLETAGMNPYYNSAIQFTARAWDAMTDPLVGYLVSKTKTRFGQFRPWLILSAPFGAASFFLLFYVPDFDSSGAKFTYYLLAVLSLQTALTTFHVPYSSMIMAITSNPVERDSCSMFRMLFELSGVLVGAGVFGAIIGNYRYTQTNPLSHNASFSNVTESLVEQERHGYMIASATISLLFIICSMIAYFGTKEVYIATNKQENFLKCLRSIMSFKPYLCAMLSFLFVSLGMQVIQGNISLYVSYSIELPNHMTYGIMVLLGTAVLFMPLVYFFMNRFGKKIAFTIGLLNIYPILIAMVYIPVNPPLWLFYGLMVWAALSVSVSFLVPWSMLPDVIDDFMVKTGVRKESVFYSLYVFFNKFAVGFTVGFSSLVLGYVGYKEGEKEQPKLVGIALRYLMAGSGVVCMTCSLVFVYLYPINQQYLKNMRQRLAKLKLEKQQDQSISSITECMDIPDVAYTSQTYLCPSDKDAPPTTF